VRYITGDEEERWGAAIGGRCQRSEKFLLRYEHRYDKITPCGYDPIRAQMALRATRIETRAPLKTLMIGLLGERTSGSATSLPLTTSII